jgi:hypothetical protein
VVLYNSAARQCQFVSLNLIFFILGLFNNNFQYLRFVPWSGRLVSKYRSGEGVEGGSCGLMRGGVLSRNFHNGGVFVNG